MRWRSPSPELLLVPLRVLPLPVTAAYLAVLHGPTPANAGDWALGMAAAALTGIGGWLPFAASLAQSALLVVGLIDGPRTVMPMLFLLTMITLGELWVRREDWRCWAGAAAFTAAQVVLVAPHFDVVLSTSSIALTTLPPVLLGVYVRSVLRRAIDAERGRERAVRDARVAERTAIARELHDLVAHHMASIAVQVGAARRTLDGSDPRVDEALAQAHGTTRAALTDLKRLMSILRDPTTTSDDAGLAMVEPAGLATALTAAVAEARAAGVTVDSEIDASVAELDSIRRLAVLRVVQEGLTNVVKHAGRDARAALTVQVCGQAVRVVVTDDGRGGRDRRRGGFGLVGLRERVALLGGEVRVRDRGPGWVLEVTIP
jgi:signal transduction histidine kinase